MILLLPDLFRLDIPWGSATVTFFSRRNCRPAANLATNPPFGGVASGFLPAKNQADCTEKSPFRQKRPLHTPPLGV